MAGGEEQAVRAEQHGRLLPPAGTAGSAPGSGLWRRLHGRTAVIEPARAFDEASARIRVGLETARQLEAGIAGDLGASARALKLAGPQAFPVQEDRRRAAAAARDLAGRNLALLAVKIGIRADDVRRAFDEDTPLSGGFFTSKAARERQRIGERQRRANPAVIAQLLGEAEFLSGVLEEETAWLRQVRKQGEVDLLLLFDHRPALREALPEAALRHRNESRSDGRMRRVLIVEKALSIFEAALEDLSRALRLVDILRHKVAMDTEELLTLHRVIIATAGVADDGTSITVDRFPHLGGGIGRMGCDRLIGRSLPALRDKVDGDLRTMLAYRRDLGQAG